MLPKVSIAILLTCEKFKLKPIGKKLFIFYLIMGAISYLVISDDSYIVTSVTPFTPFLEFSENALILLDGVILAYK